MSKLFLILEYNISIMSKLHGSQLRNMCDGKYLNKLLNFQYNECETCAPGYNLTANNTCASICPSGTFYNVSAKVNFIKK